MSRAQPGRSSQVADVNTVFAHEKDVLTKGGWILMADGQTVKTMTTAEFQAAPKVGK